ncbi:MAG: FtsX-like permease family protein, partial [Verrucomicrobiota bacterium]
MLLSALCILTVALGVAVFLAIQIVNHSALRAFGAGIDLVAGKSHLEVIGPGTNDLDEIHFPAIAAAPGVKEATPLCEGYLTIALPGRESTEYLHVVGIDPFTNSEFQTWRLSINRDDETFDPESWLREPNTVYVSEALASNWQVAPGDSIQAQVDGRTVALTIGFLYREADSAEDNAPERVASMDIGWFQELFESAGKLNSIQILLEDPGKVEEMKDQLAEALGASVRVRRPAQRSAQVETMLKGFSLNLTALSMVSILVGIFLIYNASSAGVVRRRRELGILRSIGATRSQVMTMVVGEATLLGILGVMLGIVGARFLAAALLGGVSQVISLQYVLLSIDRTYLSPLHLGQAIVFGLAASLAGAWFPAREAARVEPKHVMHAGHLAPRPSTRTVPFFFSGLFAIGLSAALAYVSLSTGPAWLSFASCFFLLAGFSLMTPLCSAWLSNVFSAAATKGNATLLRLAADSFKLSLHRYAPTVAALMAAVGMMLGVSIMISSFRNTVVEWVGQAIVADIYISPAANEIIGMKAYLPEEVRTFAEGISEVTLTETYREQEFTGPDGQLYRLAVIDGGRQGNITFADGDPTEQRDLWLSPGHVFITQVLAEKLNLQRGETISLPTPAGSLEFKIAAVVIDYSDNEGQAVLSRENFQRHWDDTRFHSLAVYLDESANVSAIVETIRAEFSDNGEFLIYSNRKIRERIYEIFDQTFAVTYVLRTVAIFVAVLGIIFTMTTLIAERVREIAAFRAIGATRRQTRGLLLREGLLVGLLASAIGVFCGIGLSFILTWV